MKGTIAYAGFWRRFLALAFDTILLTGALAGLAYAFGWGVVQATRERGVRITVDEVGDLVTVAGAVVWCLYFLMMESSPWQATIGKRLVGIRVTDLDGGRPTFWRVTARYFGKIASSATLLIGYFMAGWTKRKQGLHDILADTLVLVGRSPERPLNGARASQRMSPSQFLFVLFISLMPLGVAFVLAITIPRLHEGTTEKGPKSVTTSKAAFPGSKRSEMTTAELKRLQGIVAVPMDAAPRERKIEDPQDRLAYLDWLGEMSTRLAPKIPEFDLRISFLKQLDYECVRSGTDRQLLLALIDNASEFRKYSISKEGALGFMQVMPSWTTQLGDGDARKLFETHINLRYGTVLLRHLLDRQNGDLREALGAYRREVMGVSDEREELFQSAVIEALKGRWFYQPNAKPPLQPKSQNPSRKTTAT